MNINNFDIIKTLPPECSFQILSKLEAKDLGKCRRVSKEWQTLSSDERLWKNCLTKIKFPEGFAAREYIYTHAISTDEEILSRIQEFVNKVQFNQTGIFECLFPFNSDCKITAVLQYGTADTNAIPNVYESAIFLKGINKIRDFNQTFREERTYIIIEPRPYLLNFDNPRNSLAYEVQLILPFREEGKNRLLFTQMHTIIKNRIEKLEDQYKTKQKNRMVALASAIVLLGGYALNYYLGYKNSENQ